jgi:integrase
MAAECANFEVTRMARLLDHPRSFTGRGRLDWGSLPGPTGGTNRHRHRHRSLTRQREQVMTGPLTNHGVRYSIVYRATDAQTGRTKQVSSWDWETKDEGEDALAEIVTQLGTGTYLRPNEQTVRQFLEDDWVPSLDVAVAGGRYKQSTAESHRLHARYHIIPGIGGVMLSHLDAPTLNRFYVELLRTHVVKGGQLLSPSTVNGVHQTVAAALKDATSWGKVPASVASLAHPPKPLRHKMVTWTPAQLRHFAATVAEDRLSALWLVAMTTGLRRGELAGLRWADLDLDARRLRVAVTRLSVHNRVIDEAPKSKSSARTIALDPGTVAALRAHRLRQLEERLAAGSTWVDCGLVFVHQDGRAPHPHRFNRLFDSATRRAGLPRIRLHDLRHGYATAGLEAGVDLKVMQDRLGHSSIATTADLYVHVRPQLDQEAANRTADYIFGMADK